MIRRKFFVAGAILIQLLAIIQPRPAIAAAFRYDTNVTYRPESDTLTRVTEQYAITNQTPRQYLTEIKLSTPTDSLTELNAQYADGTLIPTKVRPAKTTRGSIDFGAQEITLTFPRQVYGQGQVWRFTLSYLATGLIEARGGAHTVFIPSITLSDPGDTYLVTVDVPLSYGLPHNLGAKATSSSSRGDAQQFVFDQTQLKDHSLALAFGDRTVYKSNFKFPLSNNGPLPRTLTVTLPPDLGNQKVRILALSPQPNNTALDEDGNILASYRLDPGQKIIVNTDVEAEVKYLSYDLAASGYKKDIPSDLVKRYTKATNFWPTQGQVAEEAQKLVDEASPVATNVRSIYDYVIAKLNYNNDKIKFNIRQGAAKALANPNNVVCLEYSDLLIAMLRSQGIPARMPVGYAYSGSLKDTPKVPDSLHSWVEAYIPGIGWMALDPTWGEKFDGFGQADLDHYAFALWGEAEDLPEATMSGTRSLGYQYEDTELSYADIPQSFVSSGAQIKLRRLALFPGLALDIVATTAPDKVASDNNYALVDSQKLDLGSLAPSQKTKLLHFSLGQWFGKSVKSEFLRQDSGQVLLLANHTSSPELWPMILVFLALAICSGVAMLRLRQRKLRNQAHSKNE